MSARPYAVTRSAAALALLSVLGPLSGLALEMALAWRYGASSTVDAFRIAALLTGLGTQLFFGYLLPHVMVPMFAEYRAKGREQEGWRLAFSLAAILSALTLLFIGWMWHYPEVLTELLGPGLAASGREEAGQLLRCFSLALLLMAWSGVASGILYVHRLFRLSALAQLIPNLSVVLAVVVAGGAGAIGLGVLLGYAAMLGLFSYGLLRIGRQAQISWVSCLKPVSREGLRKVLHLSWPLLAGILVGQWSVVVVNRVLSELPPGTLAEFGYAWKLLMLTGLLPAGLATVIFPVFSDAHANGDAAELSRLAARALRMTLLLTLPLAALLIVERATLVGLIFGRGSMSAAALDETGRLFGILLVGATAGALAAILNKVAFAMHDSKSPAAIALLSALALTLLAPAAAEAGGVTGVAWVFSLVSLLGAVLMAGYLVFRHRVALTGGLARYLVMMGVLCAGTALPVVAVHSLFAQDGAMPAGLALAELAAAGAVFIASAYGLSRMLGIGEAEELWVYAKWQVRRLPFPGKLRSSTRMS